MRPIDIACGECAQQPGEQCVGLLDGQFHPKRVEAALAEGDPNKVGYVATVEEFDDAVANVLF